MIKFKTPDNGLNYTEEEMWAAIHKEIPLNIHDIKEFIDLLKIKHRSRSKVIYYTMEASLYNNTKVNANRLIFLDPDYSDRRPIGAVSCRGTSAKFFVHNRFCRKVRGDTWKLMYADETKDIKKAVKLAFDNITAYSAEEAAHQSYNEAHEVLYSWRADTHINHELLNQKAHLNEIENLVAQGVTFKTPLFKEAAELLAQAKESHRRSQMLNKGMTYVLEDKTGLLVVGRGRGTALVERYKSLEDLPEPLLGKFSLLRIVEPGTHVPEVGYRTKDGISWLFGIDREEHNQAVATKQEEQSV